MNQISASPAGSANLDPAHAFAPDRLAYDMIQWMFLPWTMMEDAARIVANGSSRMMERS